MPFSQFWFINFSLNCIEYCIALGQCFTTSKGTSHDKVFEDKNWTLNFILRDFFKLESLVFLNAPQELSTGQCLTSSRGETSKINFAVQIGDVARFWFWKWFCQMLLRIHSNLLFYCRNNDLLRIIMNKIYDRLNNSCH